ncbi:hypothetical protein AAVH_19150 [Aphelenchoides avenae]|nr:hypothetical protein AAVH_19150 [Aphelenchus avenae]
MRNPCQLGPTPAGPDPGLHWKAVRPGLVQEATPTLVIDDETGKSFSYVRSRASRLGLGRYGVVFKGACLQSQSEVAIKLVSRRQYGDEQRAHKYFEREVATLKIGSMVSKNVVEFLGSAMDHVSLMVVTEYCEKGDMSRWMDGELSKDLDDGVHLVTVLEAYVQLANGLIDLHRRRIAHRDLKGSNVLISSRSARFVRGSLQWTYPNDPGDSPMATNYSFAKPATPFTVKIGDFGLARFLDDPDDLSVGVGTEGYMAPEVRIGAAYATNCDLYSVGVMLKRDLERSLGPDSGF